MLFILGTKATTNEISKVQSQPCAKCGNTSFTRSAAFSYLHIYFIPFFPVASSVILRCDHCGRAYAGRELQNRTANGRSPTRAPTDLFTGAILFGFFTFLLFITAGVTLAIAVKHGATLQDYLSRIQKKKSSVRQDHL